MKNMFSSIIRIAAAVSAIILLTMCSKQETEPVNSSLDVIQVTVDASVASIDTKSSFAEKKITIEDGDKLQVVAYQIEGSSYTYKYTGTLTNTADAPGTFSGTLERDPDYGSYSGSNFLQDAAAIATLIPNGVDTPVEFLEGISNENIAKLCTMQATKEAGDDPIFALEPSVSVAQFTIDGLGDIQGQTAFILVKYKNNNNVECSVEGSTTVSASGEATFSVGISSKDYVKSLTVGVHGPTEGVHIANRAWYDGIIITSEQKTLKDIINISRTAVRTKSSLSSTFDSNDIGKIFSTYGNLFSSVATCKAAGATPLCIITCLKDMIANPTYNPSADPDMSVGLAMGLDPLEVDGATSLTWSVAKAQGPGHYRTGVSGLNITCQGMPNLVVLMRMAQCCGASSINSIPTNAYELSNDYIEYSGTGMTGLGNKLKAAIEAETGTSMSSLKFWVDAKRVKERVDYPVHWEQWGFYMTDPPTTTMATYGYYRF